MATIPPLDICVDAYPPGQQFRASDRPDPVNLRSTSRYELAASKYKMWQPGDASQMLPGQVLRIRIMDGDAEIKAAIEEYAREWLLYANLRFEFGNFPDAEIRVTTYGRGYSSLVGTDAQQVPYDQATMTLGGPRGNLARVGDPAEVRRVVLHEFGHALGCIHEQARPNAPIPWDKPRVYAYYQTYHGWDQARVDANIFERYGAPDLWASEQYDTTSIMQYAVDREHTIGGYEIPWNMTLSETDKAFIATMYP
jgi:hypothetical protein